MDRETIRKAADAARNQPPVIDDRNFAALRTARAASPVRVYSPAGELSFWMVPFLVKSLACGFACLDLSGKVMRLGIFGSAPEDRASWVEASFFKKPPPGVLSEIRAKYSGFEISKPILSYAASPAKWGWKVEVRNRSKSIIFITPSGWFEWTPGGVPTKES